MKRGRSRRRSVGREEKRSGRKERGKEIWKKYEIRRKEGRKAKGKMEGRKQRLLVTSRYGNKSRSCCHKTQLPALGF